MAKSKATAPDDTEDRRAPDDEQPAVLASAEEAGVLPEEDRRIPSTPEGDEQFAEQQMDASVSVPRSALQEIDRLVHVAEHDTGHAQRQALQQARAAIAVLVA